MSYTTSFKSRRKKFELPNPNQNNETPNDMNRRVNLFVKHILGSTKFFNGY